jgi:hypothetical protein
MYTNVLRVELCGMWLVGLCALARVACGDDSEGGGGGDTVAGTPCTIGGTEAETKIDGCPTTPTMCSMAGGTVTRVCHTPGATPALPAAPAAGMPRVPTQGIWSGCCCAQNGSLFCASATAGQAGTMGNGVTGGGCVGGVSNGVREGTEMCDGQDGVPACATPPGLYSCVNCALVDMCTTSTTAGNSP